VCLGRQLLQLFSFAFSASELVQALGFMNLHSLELRRPTVEHRIAETELATQLLYRHTCLGFLQKPDYLLLGKPLLLHVRLSFQKRTLPAPRWYRLREQITVYHEGKLTHRQVDRTVLFDLKRRQRAEYGMKPDDHIQETIESWLLTYKVVEQMLDSVGRCQIGLL